MFKTHYKGVGTVVEVHYDRKKDFGLIFEEDISWESKLNYV